MAPTDNMAIDEILFLEETKKRTFPITLRFYNWSSPAFSFGYFSGIPESIISIVNAQHGKYFVRRLTGGGWVFHSGDIPFTLIIDIEQIKEASSIQQSYKMIHSIVLGALKKTGVTSIIMSENKNRASGSCFTTPVSGDILMSGKKILGGAQRRRNGVLLYQGSLMLNRPSSKITSFIPEKYNFLNEIIKNTSSIEFLTSNKLSQDKIAASISKSFSLACSICFQDIPLTNYEKEKAVKLAEKKYSTLQWTTNRR